MPMQNGAYKGGGLFKMEKGNKGHAYMYNPVWVCLRVRITLSLLDPETNVHAEEGDQQSTVL